ncbi:hypothetical protein Q3G72_019701 [Acer saccharum]|nr:hypothetical protein Q3G72_019701 [Acer saccharum]
MQVGCFLRAIMFTEKQLWGRDENGLRVWSLKELYSESGSEEDGTTPLKESLRGVSALMCLAGAEGSGSGLVWSGHIDGRVRCWKMMNQNQNRHGCLSDGFRETLSWQAHRGPVLSLCGIIIFLSIYVLQSEVDEEIFARSVIWIVEERRVIYVLHAQ